VTFDRVMLATGWGLAVSAVITIPQWFGWRGVEVVNCAGHCAAGLFLNPDNLGMAVAPVLVWAELREKSAVLQGLLGIALVLTAARVPIVAAGFGLMVGFFFTKRPGRMLLTAAAFAAALAYAFLGFGKGASFDQRLIIWSATWQAMTTWRGHGLGWFFAAAVFHQDPSHVLAWQNAHSDILQAAAELGIGIIPFAVVAAWCALARAPWAEKAAFLTAMAQTAVAFPLHLPVSGFVAALLAGRMAHHRYRGRYPDADRRI
jgi:hypothetical protein